MKTKVKTRVLFLLGFVLLLLAFSFWYKVHYSMELAQNRELNSPALATKVLVATQGSDFKNAIVTNIINFYKKDSVYIKIVDISQLQQIKFEGYNAIVILHTWEYGKPPLEVSQFISNNLNYKDSIIVFATSGEGNNKIEGIDAMAGESILENASDVSDVIIEKINKIIKKKL